VIKLDRDARILVVEDLALVNRSIEQALVSEGYAHVVAASTEDEAVALAQRQRPDVLILNQPSDVSWDEALGMAADGERIRERAQLGRILVLRLGSPAAT
jgi:DNA-binding response OmpR family regulator